jgi:hypothetical protein
MAYAGSMVLPLQSLITEYVPLLIHAFRSSEARMHAFKTVIFNIQIVIFTAPENRQVLEGFPEKAWEY